MTSLPSPGSVFDTTREDWESLGTIQGTAKVHVNTKQWLAKEEGSLFIDWKQQAMKKAVGSKKAEDESKEEARKRQVSSTSAYNTFHYITIKPLLINR